MATIVIHPDISHLPSVSFDQRNQAILEGEKAATAAMGKIRQVLAR
jgi:NTE family protein